MVDIAAPDLHAHIEADDASDIDSAFGTSIEDGSFTTSITSSVKNYTLKLTDQSHHIFRLILGGALYLSPIGNAPQSVLDLGTGTGIWAIEFADEHPETRVVGNDLSPIQPTWVPPNCTFFVDDFDKEWPYNTPFDLVHGRELEGSVGDFDRLFQQAYEHLKPGGYLEMQTMEIFFYSDDGTHEKAINCLEINRLAREASAKFGKDIHTVNTWTDRMEKAGFKNVKQVTRKLPISPWPKDPKMKELGRFQLANMLEALDSYTLSLFTRVLGWKKEEVQVLNAGARSELKDRSIHMYCKVHFVYGQKPESSRND
ncbi:hypothetical protein AJ80_06101 [Polytolypa hystricis UAMH7299]|uniref:Methyltransferase domain-containing protein n=1 Tax=Polytolypa hystricis (strain UAMH7299) TaxID=1447883 RepID=A0A2B7XYV9_POLH7|nr:hypothetical protein AJ80_06101 [Polytolypa hystricis UAMH7299]